MKVKATKGVKVPYEHKPHQYIEQEAVEVENSLYYQRRIADGDLVIVSQAVVSGQKSVKGKNDDHL